MATPITTFDDFCKAVRGTVKRGTVYQIQQLKWWFGEGDDQKELYVIKSIRHAISVTGSRLPWNRDPVVVVYYTFFAEEGEKFFSCGKWCARRMGMSKKLFRQIDRACLGLPDMDRDIRQQIRAACGL